MTVTTAPGGHHHLPIRTIALGVAGAGIAVGAAFAIGEALSEEGTTIAPGQERIVVPDGARPGEGRGARGSGDAGHRTQLQPR